MAGQNFGKNAEAYDRYRPHYRDGFYADVMDRLVERAGFCRGDVVMEIGPGTGLGTEALLARGINVIGVEPDTEMLAIAYRRLGRYATRNETEFNDRRARELPAVYFIHATFEQAAENGQLRDSFDGVAAITSIHWPIREIGQQATAQRIAALLKPGKRLATVHTPLNVYSERAAEFLHASQAFWPPEYMASLPNRTTIALKPMSEVTPRDFTPYLMPVSYEAWTTSHDAPVDEHLNLMQTFWEMLDLRDSVRQRFVDDLRQLSIAQFNASIPTAHATLLQIDERT